PTHSEYDLPVLVRPFIVGSPVYGDGRHAGERGRRRPHARLEPDDAIDTAHVSGSPGRTRPRTRWPGRRPSISDAAPRPHPIPPRPAPRPRPGERPSPEPALRGHGS